MNQSGLQMIGEELCGYQGEGRRRGGECHRECSAEIFWVEVVRVGCRQGGWAGLGGEMRRARTAATAFSKLEMDGARGIWDGSGDCELCS